ncbi:FAD-binding oxidoreductase [Mesorhizobium sp. M7A.T.Ca.TU.009.01.3.2]|uniref:NAD(P)/FAD-dependent oxidoreductase n=1 Tax=unclassified Mesorhizobium TaxID=325217 RepID=UPI000FC9E965|nr:MULTISPECIES: FAD-binding oxidoreductase [unclassified Mesorhizobium]RUU12455.1 FAD-binding oxidoreductase [Mesorhizobium sp. M7A.T.Ca.TU.009.01.3.2]RUU57250.1 FAD-binding oxidoreductase [Mesorhizobium sp. M7A.T.Ca.TU.009.01.1.1]RUV10132.1 FAD-binding oxidoreductase [Mesorhizobium sp. M7A.T.Ca.TU.009.01.3.1]RWN95588.1 MAG: FAD-binding oxidoreductase [Mesorhizobium sp.]RUT83804.1 FAD-binding oxidoreductase [Mesorhizobium sp. M7A.T.Ca.US.000.02.1.1]
MTASPHVVVIGAGTLGMCSAHALAEQGARVTVIDAQSIASGSSGRSVGVVGTQLTDPFEIQLRMQSVQRVRRWQERLGLGFSPIGYLRLARTSEQMELFARSVEIQRDAGFRSRVYQANELQQLVPHLSSDGLEGGIFGPDDGFLDPHEMCTLLAQQVKKLGSEVFQFRKLLGAARTSGGYRLDTSKGPIGCDFVVNAAGAWAPRVAEMLGQTLHIHPERHEALTIHLDAPLPYTMPMVMDLVNGQGTGLNFRHEKASELIAEIHKVSSPSPEDPDNYNEQCEEGSKVMLAEMLIERLPDLPGARLGRGWAGLYPVTADHRPYVGPVDQSEPGLITAAGAGGYGIQLAPVIGLIVADWVLKGSPASIPRTESLAPTPERNVPGTHTAAA